MMPSSIRILYIDNKKFPDECLKFSYSCMRRIGSVRRRRYHVAYWRELKT